MLQRIIAIRNVGRFKNYSAAGDVTFRRFTFVFAENGRGKTTLCAILRSLFTNTPGIVIGRKTLGSVGPIEIQLLTASGNVAFRNGVWNSPFPDIAIFDGVYVSENVFAGDVIDTEHRRNLYRVIIGAQGVAFANHLNDVDVRIRTKNTEIRDNRALLQRYMAAGMPVEAFLALPEDPQINARIAAQEQELQAARRAVELQERAALTRSTIPVFPAAFAELLARTFANVSADAEQRVTEQVDRHHMHERGETWLTEGVRYLADGSCPFCGQNVTGLELIRAYESFFGEEYHALREEVSALTTQVENALGDRAVAAIQQTFMRNENAVEFWRQYCDLETPTPPDPARLVETMTALQQAARALLRIKSGTPLEPVPPDPQFTQALTTFEALRTSLETYNGAVATANAIIAARKRQAQAANIQEVENTLAAFNAQRARYTPEVRELCASESRLQAEKGALEQERAQTREQLDLHTRQVITHYGQSINRYLERINAGFRITTPTHNYRGVTPSTTYQIIINQNAVDLGDAATPLDQPSFRNTLSAGDRTTLALAFFLAQLEQDANRAAKVVVFDDPFSSHDAFRRNHTVHQIQQCGNTSAQVIVFSHEPSFLHLIWERIPPADRKALWLARVGEENTTIVEWDIERAVQARYRADLDMLQTFLSAGGGEPRDVIQKIRPVLEAYCRNLYPTQFGPQEMMGGIIGIIRNAGAPHPLYSIVEDLDELNMYCRRYHHGENPNAAVEAVDDAELQNYVKRTLKLVGCLL